MQFCFLCIIDAVQCATPPSDIRCYVLSYEGVVGAPWPEKYAGQSPVPKFDSFHELILIDEICRCGSGGVIWGLVEGLQIGLPPVLNFGELL